MSSDGHICRHWFSHGVIRTSFSRKSNQIATIIRLLTQDLRQPNRTC